jgi:hypothetical protein
MYVYKQGWEIHLQKVQGMYKQMCTQKRKTKTITIVVMKQKTKGILCHKSKTCDQKTYDNIAMVSCNAT